MNEWGDSLGGFFSEITLIIGRSEEHPSELRTEILDMILVLVLSPSVFMLTSLFRINPY